MDIEIAPWSVIGFIFATKITKKKNNNKTYNLRALRVLVV